MIRKIQQLTLLVLLPAIGFSQRHATMNFELIKAIQNNPTSTQSVSLLVKGNPSAVEAMVRSVGGTFKYTVGEISSVIIPMNEVNTLAAVNGLSRIEGLHGKVTLLDDMTDLHIHLAPVRLGIGLPQGYDGSGVVIGVIDIGIDIRHHDFKNADGTTRIEYVWDQNDIINTNHPTGFGYGQEWTSNDINGGACPYVEHLINYNDHGTPVTGLAAGNGSAVNDYYGVAPNAGIISVDFLNDLNSNINVADGVKYICDKAFAEGKPCVVNASIGTYLGSHDGYDLAAQLIDAILDEQNGRVMVAAAGNAGDIPFHLGYDVHPDSSFTWFDDAAGGTVYFESWSDKADWQNVDFAIGADQIAPLQFQGRTQYFNVSDFDLSSGADSIVIPAWNGLGDIHIYMLEFDSTYETVVYIEPVSSNYSWRFITNGSGHLDLWSSAFLTGTSNILSTNLPDSGQYPDMDRYVFPDLNQTMVSGFTCSDHVISVANFVNRSEYIAVNGSVQILPDITGDRIANSSTGPSRTGEQKPEVAAPGATTLVTGNIITLNVLGQSSANLVKIALGGMHHRDGGTSMASPVVAGVAALYLQRHPQATWREVKDAIEMTAYQDNFTGNNLPDNKWGFGKVDAFAALNIVIHYGCTNPSSFNFDPNATVDDGSCVPLGIDDMNANNLFIHCYPNPSMTETNFYFDLGKDHEGAITICDVSGRMIDQIHLTQSQGVISFQNQFAPGLYFYRLSTHSGGLNAQKLVIME